MATTTEQNNNAAHEPYPTITVMDYDTDKANIADSSRNKPWRSCCFCIPERVGVSAILSLYFFLGVLNAASSFTGLTITESARDQALMVISGILSLSLAIAGIIGLTAVRKENAGMMRRLSIAFLVQNILQLALSAVSFALDVVFRSEAVKECQNIVDTDASSSDNTDNTDCHQFVDTLLLKEAFGSVFFEALMFYFGYVIYRYARRMSAQKDDDARNSTQQTPTYFVYATRPPTSTDWVPPPTYNSNSPPTYSGNPNNIPLTGDTKEAYNLA